MESAAELQIYKFGYANVNTSVANLYFITNSADYGGAVYVDDETNFGACINSLNVSTDRDCFLQVITLYDGVKNLFSGISVNFSQNNAQKSGTAIFGGLLDRCRVNPFAEIRFFNLTWINGVSYFVNISNVNGTNIGSDPVRLCFCRPDGQPDCSYQPPSVQVRKGENFTVSLVAVDQVNHTIQNVAIYSSLHNRESGLGVGQMTQTTKNDCTPLNFSVYSLYPSEELSLYAEGPCKDIGMSQRKISVKFLNCTCPVGFQPKRSEANDNCKCICDIKLLPYITDPNCNPYTKSLMRGGNFWITNLNDTDDSGGYSYLIYPHCPLDYCLPAKASILINLNMVNGTDSQCANNRSGLLCGVCQPSLSVSLGSSRCVACPNTWPALLATIVTVGFLLGIVLVVLLLMLNLTVAVGTLNGLIFYANVIYANSSTSFCTTTKIFNVFISWLNLELGFDTCFIKGMDTYWKIWLHLAFPMYVILLVAVVIQLSECSIRFSQLIAKKNPVATLATLILLSYTKLLRTIISALSFATLDYPDGSRKRVWLPDATIEYLSGKHIPLFLVAFLIIVVGSAYTCLLFFWQWLLHHQNRKYLRWVGYQKLCHFIEPYNAPYISKCRYWTGLLLFARVALYLVFALNVSGDPGVNLLALIVITSSILFLKGSLGRLYKNWILDVMEMACYLNIILFSAAMLFTLEAGINQTVIAYVSGAITFVLLLLILVYHVFTELFLKILWKKLKERRWRIENNSPGPVDYPSRSIDGDYYTESEPTSTIIDGLPPRNRPLQTLAEDKNDQRSNLMNEDNDDNVSTNSMSSMSLLPD